MKFITLTNKNGSKIRINVEFIIYYYDASEKYEEPIRTVITLKDNHTVAVIETVDEVERLIKH